MKILWVSNGLQVPTGYGVQTRLFVPRLQAAGHQIAIFAYVGQEYTPQTIDGVVQLPGAIDKHGNDVVDAHAEALKADIVWGLFDPHMAAPAVYQKFPWAQWVPSDCIPPVPQNIYALQKGHCRWVWAFSKFGQTELEKAGFNVTYCPLATDTQMFKPGNRTEIRQRIGKEWGLDLTDKFLVVSTGANQGKFSRKGFPEILRAFKALSDKHPNALLYLHTDNGRGISKGGELDLHIDAWDIDPRKVIFPNQYAYRTGMLTEQYLSDVYNAADLYIQMSYGEGFGVPIVDAQACGCPVLVNDFSSMTELCLSGWKVSGHRLTYWPGTDWQIPDLPEATEKLENAYQILSDPDKAATWRKQAANLAAAYDIEMVIKLWMLPGLETIAGDLEAEKQRQTIKRIPARKVVTDKSNGKPKAEVIPA